jgi:hypothetical protein
MSGDLAEFDINPRNRLFSSIEIQADVGDNTFKIASSTRPRNCVVYVEIHI